MDVLNTTMSAFAHNIMEMKYAHTKPDGTKETWEEIAHRVAKHVLKAVDAPKSQVDATANLIADRKLVPGGRYLYAAGRPFHQVQNCLLMRAEDSREGWASHLEKCAMALMTGAGIGIDYSGIRPEGTLIRKTGGFASGPIALMQMTNECGRGIMQGGSRRSAIWAGLNWAHADIHKFIGLKNWSEEVRAMKDRDFNFPATMDMTNISVQLDDEFFKAYHNEKHKLHAQAQSVYWATVRQMLKTAEPGFSVDTGVNKGETLRNACMPAWATVMTPQGIRTIGDILPDDTVWSGQQWTKVVKKWWTGRKDVYRYGTRSGSFVGTADHKILSNGEKIEVNMAEMIDICHNSSLMEIYHDPQDVMDGIVFGDGYVHRASNNLPVLCIGAKDGDYHTSEIAGLIKEHRPGIGDTSWEIFTTIPEVLQAKTPLRVIPNAFYFSNEQRVAGFLRGLFTANGSLSGPRITLKAASFRVIEQVQEMLSFLGIRSYYTTNKAKSIEWANGTYTSKESYDINITGTDRAIFADRIGFIQGYKTASLKSIVDATSFKGRRKTSYEIVEKEYLGVHDVYDIMVEAEEHTFWTGGLLVSNCTEVTSSDDSDICNLGSINMARITSLSEMATVVELGVAFLLAGTVYSDVPYSKVDHVRTKNRRLGLGLMGLHEWMLLRGHQYGPSDELAEYMEVYATSTSVAAEWAEKWELSAPVKTRAIAPTGTIGIVAETSTGIEPVFCVAYKRRYLKGQVWQYQYVIDPTAKRLIESGVRPESIEDAYVLAEDSERRVAFQAWLQRYVDHSISSTLNLPAWGSELNNDNHVGSFGRMLIKYLPDLRGITCYPDGARGGQPLSPVKYQTASRYAGEVFVEAMDICDITRGGSCGS